MDGKQSNTVNRRHIVKIRYGVHIGRVALLMRESQVSYPSHSRRRVNIFVIYEGSHSLQSKLQMQDLDVSINLALQSFERKLRIRSASLRKAVKEAEAALNEALPRGSTSKKISPKIFMHAPLSSSVSKPQRAHYNIASSAKDNNDIARSVNRTTTAKDDLQYQNRSNTSPRVSTSSFCYGRSLSLSPRVKRGAANTIRTHVYSASGGRTRTLRAPFPDSVSQEKGDAKGGESDCRTHTSYSANGDAVDPDIGISRDIDNVVGNLIRKRALVWRKRRQRIVNDAIFALEYSGSSTACQVKGSENEALRTNTGPRRPGSASYRDRGSDLLEQANPNYYIWAKEASDGPSSFGITVAEENEAVSAARVMEQVNRNNRGEKVSGKTLPSDKALLQEEESLNRGSLDHLKNDCDGTTQDESKASDGEKQTFKAPWHTKLMAKIGVDKKMKGLHGARHSCLERKQRGDAGKNYQRQLACPETGRYDNIEYRERCSPANEAAFVGNDNSDASAGAWLEGGETTPSPLPSPPAPWKPMARSKVAAFSQQSASLMHQSSPGTFQLSAKHFKTEDRSTSTKYCTDAVTQLSTDEDLNFRSDLYRGVAIAPESTKRQQQSPCEASEWVSSQSCPPLLNEPPPVLCGHGITTGSKRSLPQHRPFPPTKIGTLSPVGDEW